MRCNHEDRIEWSDMTEQQKIEMRLANHKEVIDALQERLDVLERCYNTHLDKLHFISEGYKGQ